MHELFSLTIFQWNSSLEETSSSQIIYLFIFKTICAFAPDSNHFKIFCGTHLYKRRVPAVLNLSTSKCHVSCFLRNLSLLETSSMQRQVPRKAISLISFKTVFFCKIVLKIKLLSKIPLDSDDKQQVASQLNI